MTGQDRCKEYAGYGEKRTGNKGFADWLMKVNAICNEKTGLDIFDFEDWVWFDAYENQEPEDAFHSFAEDVGITPDGWED